MLCEIPWIWEWDWQLGTLGEWVSGLGALGAIITAFFLQSRNHQREDDRRREDNAKHREEQRRRDRAEQHRIRRELVRGIKFQHKDDGGEHQIRIVNSLAEPIFVHGMTIRPPGGVHEDAPIRLVDYLPEPHWQTIGSYTPPSGAATPAEVEVCIHFDVLDHEFFWLSEPPPRGYINLGPPD